MNQPFDSDAIAKLGWRQGAILDAKLAETACSHAPATVTMGDGDWLIVTSHDCDVVNFSLAKEPVVEVMRAGVAATKKVSITLARAPRDHRDAARPRGTTGKRRGPRGSSR